MMRTPNVIRVTLVALMGLGLLAAGCAKGSDPHSAGQAIGGEDEKVKTLGSIEVTARLAEIPEGAIFLRDLYHYATILKYEVVTVHRGDLKPGTIIYVGHYDPWKPRNEAADKQVKDVGGNLKRFEAGRLERMALDPSLDDSYMGAIVDKYFGKRTGSAYWAVWTDSAE
jgi:hypothetical protein